MAMKIANLFKMDTLDQQLLALLRTDARASVATLAAKLKVSRGTVTNRIARLEDGGVITGYTVRLRPDAAPDQIRAWMSITVDGNRTREVVAMLLGEPGITGLFDTNGRWDLLAEISSSSLQELAEVLERVRLIKGIAGTETSIHLQSYKLA
jgi:DNA-binding Lrp family transcriptional regulator